MGCGIMEIARRESVQPAAGNFHFEISKNVNTLSTRVYARVLHFLRLERRVPANEKLNDFVRFARPMDSQHRGIACNANVVAGQRAGVPLLNVVMTNNYSHYEKPCARSSNN